MSTLHNFVSQKNISAEDGEIVQNLTITTPSIIFIEFAEG